jgi:hypothetical protein
MIALYLTILRLVLKKDEHDRYWFALAGVLLLGLGFFIVLGLVTK